MGHTHGVARPDPAESRGGALDPKSLERDLSHLYRAVASRNDPALATLFAAAEEIAAEWTERLGQLHRCRGALEEAESAELRTRQRLESVIRAICELGQVRDDKVHVKRHRRRWLRRHRAEGETERTRDRGSQIRDSGQPPQAELQEPARRRAGDRATTANVPNERHEVDGPPDRSTAGHRPSPAAQDRAIDSALLTPRSHGPPPGSIPVTPDESEQPTRHVDIAIYYLGPFRLLLRGQSADLPSGGKGIRILKYLLANPRRSVPKDVLIDRFWPDADADTGQRNLHQALYSVRKALRTGEGEFQIVVYDNGAYHVGSGLEIWSDVEEYERQARRARQAHRAGRFDEAMSHYLAAEALYSGDYLEDSPYEEWLLGERERLRLLYVDVADSLSGLRLEAGDIHGALEVSQSLLQHEPCDETAHRRAMSCYAALGQRHLVVRQYRACVDNLERAYGLKPSADTIAYYSHLIG
jgi:DNA-binding SARP family transcriptional activator